MNINQFNSAKCDGIDLFFKSKPAMNMALLLKLVKMLNIGVILNQDTSPELAAHPLMSELTIEHAPHDHSSPGYNGKCYRITCRWANEHTVNGLEVLERLRAVFDETSLGYIGAELYMNDIDWSKRQVTEHGVKPHTRTINGVKRQVRGYVRGV